MGCGVEADGRFVQGAGVWYIFVFFRLIYYIIRSRGFV